MSNQSKIGEGNMDITRQKILIIDDSPLNLSVLKSLLANLNYELFFAESGIVGLQVAAETKPDLILLDIVMPQMDGFEVLRELKNTKGLDTIPVIFLTALNDDETKLKAFNEGAVDYISKPFNAAEVVARARAHLEIARLTNSLDFLLKMVAHEFIIPLSVIDTSLQMQKMDHGESEYVDSIGSASTTLQGVYKNMAYFLGSKKHDQQKKMIPLGDFAKSRAEYLEVLATAYKCSFELEEIDDEIAIFWRESELERVVDNLLSNAAKHSIGDTTIKIKVSQVDGQPCFEAKNRCRHIENSVKLFEEFYKGSKESSGLGLGLHITLKICEYNGAAIGVHHEGDAVSFRVCFGEQK